jgi:hypothetical protein
MKSHNKHPQWYNAPLRLTKDQKNNPIKTFDDFFSNYHLNEVREIFWLWLVEVLSSRHNISNEYKPSHHLYFYEKIEELVEAAFVMHKKSHSKQKRRLRKKWRIEKLRPFSQ